MKMDDKIEKAINKQINAELYSAYVYLSMSAYFEDKNLTGFAAWMKKQAQEEVMHAMKFFDYVNDRDGRVELAQIQAPPIDWKSPEDVFITAYKHEQSVTKMIHDLTKLAATDHDRATITFLDWFITEQIEEEAIAKEILDRIKIAGNTGPGIILIDRELGDRGSKEE